MIDLWIKDIQIGALPEPFGAMADAIELGLVEVLPKNKNQKALAKQLAHSSVLALLIEFEGDNTYWPILDGDKFCNLRHIAIRSDFRKFKGEGKKVIKELRKKYKVSARTIRTLCPNDHENQKELFD